MSITFPPENRASGAVGGGLIKIRNLSPPPNSQMMMILSSGVVPSTSQMPIARQTRRGSGSPVKKSKNVPVSRSTKDSGGDNANSATTSSTSTAVAAAASNGQEEKLKNNSQQQSVISSTKSNSHDHGVKKNDSSSPCHPAEKQVVQEDFSSNGSRPSSPSASHMFWGDVTNRTKALSIPTSFQKRQKQKDVD